MFIALIRCISHIEPTFDVVCNFLFSDGVVEEEKETFILPGILSQVNTMNIDVVYVLIINADMNVSCMYGIIVLN